MFLPDVAALGAALGAAYAFVYQQIEACGAFDDDDSDDGDGDYVEVESE